MSKPNTDNVQAYIEMEMRRFESRLTVIESNLKRASTLTELARDSMQIATASSIPIRALCRSHPGLTRVKAFAVRRAEDLVATAVLALRAQIGLPDEQFLNACGRFIEEVREPCRGHFPNQYHVADIALHRVRKERESAQTCTTPATPPAPAQSSVRSARP